MSRSAEQYAALIEELKLAWEQIEGQFAKNRQMTARVAAGSRDEMAWAALGYTIHNFYNALEGYFLRVAKFFENRLDEPAWHAGLVDRMTLSIEGVRPALLPKDLRRPVHELRGFRHVFRNIYDTELDPARVEQTNRTVEAVYQGLRPAHEAFLAALKRISEGL